MDVEFLWEVRGPGRAAVLIEILCKNRSMIQVWHFGFMMCRIQPKQITLYTSNFLSKTKADDAWQAIMFNIACWETKVAIL